MVKGKIFSLIAIMLFASVFFFGCTKEEYKIVFDTGETIIEYTIKEGVKVVEPQQPTKEGYTFLGWYDNQDYAGEQVTFNFGSTKSKTFFAKWNINEYTTTFYIDNEAFEQTTQNYDTIVAFPNTDREGYTFSGWYDNPSMEGEKLEEIKVLSQDRELYGTYSINQYTITFSTYFNIVVDPLTVDFGAPLELPILTMQNYNFLGWTLDTLRQVPNTYTTMPAQDITLYSHFVIKRYDVHFETNGGSQVESKSLMVGYTYDDLYRNLPTTSKTGYRFDGWYTNAALTQQNFNGRTPMPEYDVTLYAKFTPITYYITYELNGAYSWESNLTYHDYTIVSPTIVLKSAVRTGYNFLGWYNNSSLTTQVTTIPQGSMGNRTFYAKWELKEVTITFETNGGSTVLPITKLYNTQVSAPTNPTKNGYSFDGWFTNTALTTAYTFSTMPANDMVLYAKWIHEYLTLEQNGNITIKGLTSYGNSFRTLDIPEQIEGKPVVAIAARAFENKTTLKNLTISKTITNIGLNILFGTGLTTLTAPFLGTYSDNTNSYLAYYFNGTAYYQDNKVPSSLKTVNFYGTTVANYAFYKCTYLETVNYLDELTRIGDSAFMMCYGLKNLTLPNTLQIIGNGSFRYCTRLTTFTIPESVHTIGEYVFSESMGLTSLSILNANATIGRGILSYLENVQIALTVPFKATGNSYIAYYFSGQNYMFNSEINVRNLTITEGTTVIPQNAFNEATSLRSVTMPNSVITIQDYAFYGCVNLTSVTFSQNLTHIGNNAFNSCYSLTNVVIPDLVTYIGNFAFLECNLQTINIPSGVEFIGNQAFYKCKITSIIIPISVTTIGQYAFSTNADLVIYCEAASKPAGWNNYWNADNYPVVFGYVQE